MSLSDNSNLFKSLLDSYTGFSRSFILTNDLPTESSGGLSVNDVPNFLQVQENQESVTITFDGDKYPTILDLLEKKLLLFKDSNERRHGSIYKSQDKTVTVTIYETTSSLHIQGESYFSWYREFLTDLNKLDVNLESNCKTLDETSPQCTSTPKGKTSQNCQQCISSAKLIQELSDTVKLLSQEVSDLKQQLNGSKNVTSLVSRTTQTTPNRTKQKETSTDGLLHIPAGVSRHTQCTLKAPTISNSTCTMTDASEAHTRSFPTSPDSNTKHGTNQPRKTPTDKSVFIIGSSILQRIRTRGLHSTVQVNTNRGANISHIRSKLSKMDVSSYRSVIIMAGRNDASRRRDPEAIENDFAEVITDLRNRNSSISVFISEVLPRRDTNTSEVNGIIKSVCEMYGGTVIATSKFFGRENPKQEYYWKDNIHLSDRGTAELLKIFHQYVSILKVGNVRTNGEESEILGSTSFRRPAFCYFCGESGHISRYCRHGRKLDCWNCGELGHKTKLCPNGH